MVWENAAHDLVSYFRKDKRSWVGGGIAGVGSALASPYLLGVFGGEMTAQPFYVQLLVAVFCGAIGLLAFAGALFLWNIFWSIPAKMFREEQVKARKFTWDDVIFEDLQFPENSPVSVGIYVKSVKPSLLKDIYARIVSIEHKGQDILDKYLPLPILNNDKKFDWSATDIEFSKSKSFVLFKTSLREGMREYSDTLELFIPSEGCQPDTFEPAQYFEEYNKETLPVYITVEFHSSVDGHAIYPDKRLVYRVDCRNNKPIVELAGES